jgi:predicted PurR-regulated permease PerM
MNLFKKIKIRNKAFPSSLSALLVIVLFYTVIIGFIGVFVPIILQQGKNLAEVDYSNIVESLEEPIAHVSDWMVEKGLSNSPLSDYVESDSTIKINPAIDTTKRLEKTVEPAVFITRIDIDSLVDLTAANTSKTNISLNLALSLPTTEPDPVLLDEEAISPFDQIKDQALHYFSPSKIITQTVFYTVSLFGNILILLTSVTFIAFFFLKDEKLFGNGLKIIIPQKHFFKTDQAMKNIKKLLTRYFGGVLLQITIITIFLTTMLSFCGVSNAFLIGFFSALINVIPYIGPLIGALFAIMVTISSNLDADFYTTMLPLIYRVILIFAVMQACDGFLLQPYIFSNSVSAHPLEIFLIIIVGAQLGGAVGMVLAIPAYTIIRVVAAVFLQEFEIVRKMTDHLSEDGDIEVDTRDTPPLAP